MRLTAAGAAALAAKICEVLHGPGVTREWDEKFLRDMLGKLERFGAETRISAKQWEQIERILPDWEASADAELNPNRFPYADHNGRSPWHK